MHPDKKIHEIAEGGPVQVARSVVWYEEVENHGPKEVTAVLVTYHCKTRALSKYAIKSPGRGFVIYDFLATYHANSGIGPGGSARLRLVLGRGTSDCSAGVDAVLFADGSSAGERADVGEMRLRRQGTYEALGKAIPLMEKVAGGQMTVAEALRKLGSYRGAFAVQLYAEQNGNSGGLDVPDLRFSAPPPGYGAPIPDPKTGWYTEDEVNNMDDFYAGLEAALSSLGKPSPPRMRNIMVGSRSGTWELARSPWMPAAAQKPGAGCAPPMRNVMATQTPASTLSAELQAWRAALDGHVCR